MIIKRKHRDAYGNWVETPVRIDNPKVIKLYRKKAKERTLARMKSVASLFITDQTRFTDNVTATTPLYLPATANSTPLPNRSFARSLPVSSVTKNAACTASVSRLVIWQTLLLLVVPQQLRLQAKAQHRPVSLRQLDRHPHPLRHLPNQAKDAARMALHASAPTVDKSATSKPTESQYPSPFLNVSVNARSQTSGPMTRMRANLKPRAKSQARPKVRLARLLLRGAWACDLDPTSFSHSSSLPLHEHLHTNGHPSPPCTQMLHPTRTNPMNRQYQEASISTLQLLTPGINLREISCPTDADHCSTRAGGGTC